MHYFTEVDLKASFSWANKVKLQRIGYQCAALILETLNRNSSRITTYRLQPGASISI